MFYILDVINIDKVFGELYWVFIIFIVNLKLFFCKNWLDVNIM